MDRWFFITATLITSPDFNLQADGFYAGEAMASLLEAICPRGQKADASL